MLVVLALVRRTRGLPVHSLEETDGRRVERWYFGVEKAVVIPVAAHPVTGCVFVVSHQQLPALNFIGLDGLSQLVRCFVNDITGTHFEYSDPAN